MSTIGTLGITGHRPPRIGGYGPSVTARLDRLARRTLDLLEPERVVLGMAQGTDMAFGFACVALGVPFDAYLPFATQSETWPRAAQERYDRLLAQAASVTIVCRGGYDPAAMQVRNIAICDASDMLAALWDGVRHGGTYNCIDHAMRHRARPLPVFHMWAEWLVT